MLCLRVGIADEHYALPVAVVREVDRDGVMTQVPGAPAAVLGLRNLRGRLIPVLDCARLLELPHPGAFGFVVVVEHDGWLAALGVDHVHGVQDIADELEPVEEGLLEGAAPLDGALVGIVDVPALLRAAQTGALT